MLWIIGDTPGLGLGTTALHKYAIADICVLASALQECTLVVYNVLYKVWCTADLRGQKIYLQISVPLNQGCPVLLLEHQLLAEFCSVLLQHTCLEVSALLVGTDVFNKAKASLELNSAGHWRSRKRKKLHTPALNRIEQVASYKYVSNKIIFKRLLHLGSS